LSQATRAESVCRQICDIFAKSSSTLQPNIFSWLKNKSLIVIQINYKISLEIEPDTPSPLNMKLFITELNIIYIIFISNTIGNQLNDTLETLQLYLYLQQSYSLGFKMTLHQHSTSPLIAILKNQSQ